MSDTGGASVPGSVQAVEREGAGLCLTSDAGAVAGVAAVNTRSPITRGFLMLGAPTVASTPDRQPASHWPWCCTSSAGGVACSGPPR